MGSRLTQEQVDDLRGESRWPPAIVLCIAIAVPVLLPDRFSLASKWIEPTLLALLLVSHIIADPGRIDRHSAIRLSALEGLEPYYDLDSWTRRGGEGYRLPTEAEWEYACRAGARRGSASATMTRPLGDYAWFIGNSGEKTHPVGQKRPNAFGLHDMHGNVWEWCCDSFDPLYYAQSPGADPHCAAQAVAPCPPGRVLGRWPVLPPVDRPGRELGGQPRRRRGVPRGPRLDLESALHTTEGGRRT